MQSSRHPMRLIRLKRVKTYLRYLVFLVALAFAGATVRFEPTPDMYRALAAVSANSLRGHLSFIASDLLEGRDTPSRGLDTAAEYIAAQFRRAGLEGAGDDGYFQTANFKIAERDMSGFQCKLDFGSQSASAAGQQANTNIPGALKLDSVGVVKVDFKDSAALDKLDPKQVEGKVVLTEATVPRGNSQEELRDMQRQANEFRRKISALKPALLVLVDRNAAAFNATGNPARLI